MKKLKHKPALIGVISGGLGGGSGHYVGKLLLGEGPLYAALGAMIVAAVVALILILVLKKR